MCLLSELGVMRVPMMMHAVLLSCCQGHDHFNDGVHNHNTSWKRGGSDTVRSHKLQLGRCRAFFRVLVLTTGVPRTGAAAAIATSALAVSALNIIMEHTSASD